MEATKPEPSMTVQVIPEMQKPSEAETKPPAEPTQLRDKVPDAKEENQAVNYEIDGEDDLDDAAFEQMLQEFDDDKIGELGDDEVDAESGVPASTYTHLCDDFIEKRKKDWGVKP